MIFLFDKQSFNPEGYGSESIKTETAYEGRQFYGYESKYVSKSRLLLNVLEDDTDFLQIGQTYERTHTSYFLGNVKDSYNNKYPGKYDFIANYIILDNEASITHRSTAGLFDFIAEVGGLIDILFIIMSPFA